MYNAYSIQHSFDLHHPPPCVLSQCPSHYCAVAFQDRCAQVFQIYGNRKLTDPQFQQKMWLISIHPCRYIKLQSVQLKLCFRLQLYAFRQKHPWEAVLLFWDEDIALLEHTKWSTILVAVNHSGSHLSLCTHKLIHKQCWQNPIIHPVLTSRVCFFHYKIICYIYSDIPWSVSTQ